MTTIVDASFFNAPYQAYEKLREQGAVHWSEEFCGGAWLLTDYADVAQVLRDPGFSTRRAGGWANSAGTDAKTQLREFKKIFSRSMLFVDAPQHPRLRQVMNAGFKPALIHALRPQITAIVEELLNNMANEETVDFVAVFARQLPARVIAEMLGVDKSDQFAFFSWSDDVAEFIGSPTPTLEIALRAQASLVALNQYFQDLLPERRCNPGTDLVSRLIQAEEQGLIITNKELLAQCCTLLFAGHETTRNLLGNGLFTFLQYPDQWQRLQRTPSLMTSALRELLRFESPVQYTGRRVKTDVQMHGHLLRKGDLVIPLIGSANRDPRKFQHPERFDIGRNEGNHLSFGHGPHVCVGATLTYLEAEIAFTALMQQMPDLHLAGTPPAWNKNAVYRSLDSLRICIPSNLQRRRAA